MIATGCDRDGEIKILIENQPSRTSQAVYIDKRVACDIIDHFNEVFQLGYLDNKQRDKILFFLETMKVGSCTCVTKTHHHEYHSKDCRYRIICEMSENLGGLL